MTDHARLLSEFIDDWNAGLRPALDSFVSRAREDERAALEDGIAAFLETAPLPRYDEQALAALRSEPAVQALADAVRRQDPWTELLPRLRRRRGLSPPTSPPPCATRSASARRMRRARGPTSSASRRASLPAPACRGGS